MTTLNKFQGGIANVFASLQGVSQALMSIDSGCRRGSDIMQSIGDYKLDIDRDTAKAAVTEINNRIENLKAKASEMQPINFDEHWPEDAPLLLSELMEAEALMEATTDQPTTTEA
jgi:hypothetical protein